MDDFLHLNVILLITGIFSIILSTILLSKKTVNKNSTFLLALFYLIYAVYALQTYVIVTDLLKQYTWFYAWPLPLYGLFIVPIYFYFISIIDDDFKWKWSYLFLFIPFLLGSIDVILLYLKPNSVYDKLIADAIINPQDRFNAKYGLLTLNQHYTIRHLWQLVYLIAIFPKLRNFLIYGNKEKLKITLNRWLYFFYFSLIIFSLVTSILGIERIFGITIIQPLLHFQTVTFIVNIVFYIIILAIVIIPLYFPTILYGFPKKIAFSALETKAPVDSSIAKFGLDNQELVRKLQGIEDQNLFLKQDFDLSACAQLLGIQPHHLSYFLNQEKGVSFNNYRNAIRMDNAKTLIDNGFMKINTIDALAQECGFASRSSFSRTFKNFTTQSVSEYQLKKR